MIELYDLMALNHGIGNCDKCFTVLKQAPSDPPGRNEILSQAGEPLGLHAGSQIRFQIDQGASARICKDSLVTGWANVSL